MPEPSLLGFFLAFAGGLFGTKRGSFGTSRGLFGRHQLDAAPRVPDMDYLGLRKSFMVLETCLGGAHGHKVGTGFGMDKLQQWGAGGGFGGVGLCPSARMATTGFHNKIEKLFLVIIPNPTLYSGP